MKKKMLFGFCVFATGIFMSSCISMHDRIMSGQELNEFEILHRVKVQFPSFQPLHIHLSSPIKKTAYDRLLVQAKRELAGRYNTDLIEIRNIRIEGVEHPSLGLLWKIIFPLIIVSDWQLVTATGDVVMNSADRLRRDISAATRGIDGAIYRMAERLKNGLPPDATISILNISSTEENSRHIIEELEFMLHEVGATFTLVDRRMLEQIRTEQNLQISGDVSDESAVGIGKMLGASIVIMGSAGRANQENRLTLRALDVMTARVVLTARETY